MSRPRIGFAGMTHLGLNSAAAAAVKGFDVVAFDTDPSLISRLRLSDLPVSEPGLDAAIAEHKTTLSFSSNLEDLLACDVIYVAPDVPTDDRAVADVAPVRTLVELIAPRLKRGKVLVVLSQVQPGFCRRLEIAHDMLYYQVETLVFGQAFHRAANPERFIVGCADPDKPLPNSFETFLGAFGCPILRMTYESAELAKIAINCCLVGSISIANTLADLCEKIGANWSEIVPALRMDKRIGAYSYISPGLGIAGGNLERDLSAVVRMGASVGSDTGVIRATIANSRYRKYWVLRELHDSVLHARDRPKLGILGIAYKKDTASIKNSPSVSLMRALKGFEIAAYDPKAALPQDLTGRISLGDSALAVAQGADAIAIMTPWDAFADIAAANLAERMAGRVLLDPYAVVNRADAFDAGLDYRTLGLGTGVSAAAPDCR